MNVLHVSLFGQFHVQCEEWDLSAEYAPKVRELFSYLILHRDRPHAREALASVLWGDSTATQSRKNLRQTLWQLQTHLNRHIDWNGLRVLRVEPGWVQFTPAAALSLDVELFDHTFKLVCGTSARQLDTSCVQALCSAVQLYKGDLLEGWYQDWCLFERERLQNMLLMMLDRLAAHSEACHDYDAGLIYGMQILRVDPARERTHRQMMRLYCLAGDRTAALRQYERCVAALRDQLDVCPAQTTVELYDQIRADRFPLPKQQAQLDKLVNDANPQLLDLLARLRDTQSMLAETQQQVRHYLQTVESVLAHPS